MEVGRERRVRSWRRWMSLEAISRYSEVRSIHAEPRSHGEEQCTSLNLRVSASPREPFPNGKVTRMLDEHFLIPSERECGWAGAKGQIVAPGADARSNCTEVSPVRASREDAKPRTKQYFGLRLRMRSGIARKDAKAPGSKSQDLLFASFFASSRLRVRRFLIRTCGRRLNHGMHPSSVVIHRDHEAPRRPLQRHLPRRSR